MSDPSAAQPAAKRTDLSFKTDRGASRSFWLACAMLIAIIAWMGSGFITAPEPEVEQAEAAQPLPPSVVTRQSTADSVQLTFRAQGQALPERDTDVVAEVSGTVLEIPVDKGDSVARGDVIAQLDAQIAEAALAQAEEERTRAQREFDNAQTLLERGAATLDRVTEARATLAAAEAQVSSAQESLEHYTVLAPFDGRIEALMLNDGEYASAGAAIARLVDNDPITVAIQVPQQTRDVIQIGQPAKVLFGTGQTGQGVVTFVGSAATSETRTFLAEIKIDNGEGNVPAGVSAEVVIPTGEERAHFVEASVISLNSEGTLGVKTVVDDSVTFQKVEIVNAEIDGLWVSGLPETAEIITVGQGFVRPGETVRAQREEAAETTAQAAPEDAAAAVALPSEDQP